MIARRYRALGNPYRLQIICMLRMGTMSAGEIAKQFDIAQPSISRHLDVLKRAELVLTERRANQIMYSLNMSALQDIIVYMTELFVGKVILAEQLEKCDE